MTISTTIDSNKTFTNSADWNKRTSTVDNIDIIFDDKKGSTIDSNDITSNDNEDSTIDNNSIVSDDNEDDIIFDDDLRKSHWFWQTSIISRGGANQQLCAKQRFEGFIELSELQSI